MKVFSKWISITYRHSQIYFAKAFEALGLGSGQYMFVLCICENSGLTQDALAEEVAMNKSTVARAVSQLEKDGFIERKVNQEDKRIYNVFPTEKGMAIYPLIIAVLDTWNDLITEDLTEEEEKILDALLIKVQKSAICHGKQKGECKCQKNKPLREEIH